MKASLVRLFLISAVLVGVTVAVRAEDLDTIRGRMEKRLPQLDELKVSGAVGENNQGFVEVRAAKGDAAAVTVAENADRTAVYAAIAAKTGLTPDVVGKHRAKEIARRSAAGVWIQGEDGTWKKK